jgi:hypothetical protein
MFHVEQVDHDKDGILNRGGSNIRYPMFHVELVFENNIECISMFSINLEQVLGFFR